MTRLLAFKGCGETRMRWQLVGLCALLVAGASCASDSTENVTLEPTWLAASDHTLDQLRGGFDFGSGLQVSFGITRAVFVNGRLAASTTLQFGDLGKLSAAQAAAIGSQAGVQALVVQNGSGNAIAPSALSVALATYIQNTLSNQTLGTQTIINASTNGLSLVKSLNVQATVKDAITRAVGVR